MQDASGDWNKEDEEPEAGRWVNAPVFPKPPMYKGCTMVEKRAFMRDYESYFNQCKALETEHSRPFIMPVSSCIEDRTRSEIARNCSSRCRKSPRASGWRTSARRTSC